MKSLVYIRGIYVSHVFKLVLKKKNALYQKVLLGFCHSFGKLYSNEADGKAVGKLQLSLIMYISWSSTAGIIINAINLNVYVCSILSKDAFTLYQYMIILRNRHRLTGHFKMITKPAIVFFTINFTALLGSIQTHLLE